MNAAHRPTIPSDTPRISLVCRTIDGVPLLFTERGEYVEGLRSLTVKTAMRSAVTADVEMVLAVDDGS